MAKFSYTVTTPEGEFDVDSDTELSQAQAYQYATGKKAAAPKPKVQVPQETYDPAEGMNFAEKALVGAGGGLRKLYLGGKDLIGQGTPEEAQELQDWSKSKEHLGAAGMIGETGAEMLATAPLGGVVGAAGKGLTMIPKAGKALQAAGNVGGRYLNLGRAAGAGTEAALSAGIVKPEEGDTRLGNMATAGSIGAVAPTVMTGLSSAAKPILRAAIPTQANANTRAIQTFEKTLGKDRLANVEAAVRNAPPSRVPLTTAATADDAYVGAMEGGARVRNNPAADFQAIDKAQALDNFNNLITDTATLQKPEHLAARVGKIKEAGNSALQKFRVDDGAQTVLKNEVEHLHNTSEVWNNPKLRSKIGHISNVLETNKKLTAQDVKVLYDQLDSMKDVPAVRKIRESLSYVGNYASQDLFTKIDDVALKAQTAADEAKAAQAIKNRFISDQGTIAGDVGVHNIDGTKVPAIKSGQLRDTVRRYEAQLTPERQADISNTIESLRKRELFDPVADVGGSKLNTGDLRGPISRAVSSTGAWKARPFVDVVTGAANKKALTTVDTALADPQKFLSLMDAKKLRGAPLSARERFMMDMLINAPARSIGASQGE